MSPRAAAATGLVLACAALAVLSALAGAGPYHAVGNADPGALVSIGAPVLRLLADVAAALTVGALVFTGMFTRPQQTGLLSGPGYAELRIAGRAATAWAVIAVLLVPWSAAATAGLPLGTVLDPAALVGLIGASEEPRAWLVTAVAAAVVAVGSRLVLRWHPALLLLGTAVFAVLPPLVTGHGSGDMGHDLALAALVVHVPAAAIWFGGLFAVLRRGRTPEHLARYARLATGCWLVLIGSGLVLGLVLAPPGQWLSGYGLVLAVKTVFAIALGAAGLRLRRRARFWRAELLTLLGLFALSADLTHLSVPAVLGRAATTTQAMLGYDLAGPPTVLRLLTEWRIDPLFAPLAILLALAYLAGVRRVRGYGQPWPAGRTAAWLAGCAVVLVATSSGLGRYAAAMFSMHMAAHMLLSMLAPALLVLGGPLTLVRTARPVGTGLPGLRDWLDLVRDSTLVRALTHPFVVLVLFAGSPFALYFTGLFDAAARFHWAHLAIDAWFLGVGYLFLWPVIGVDAAPRPLPNAARLGLLLAAMPADILFGAVVLGTSRLIGNGVASAQMYSALALPWVPDLHADQRLAGLLALVVGELTLLVVLGALIGRWARVDADDEPELTGLTLTARTGRGQE
ncbi:cytochrome c oxidase assembly protein [Amycolatopsis alkalitolerans]|uniref:Copper resistance protein CopD n=1 Tax=Amycolatopsis alkalitolerans TaxID=2547244 RepID=A0A5C4LSW6_9PSEU|nr:cytochrome c oxidase assembly protein [Amycolatopsis alkalitolerans]TNC20202.1 copper resistance protein CopD [Amycolatopsis alkalitolerans]